jgi:membrane protein DedA with SNARE-associated domain
MAREHIRQARIPEAFTEVLSDFGDLFTKEVRLAKAEMSENISTKVRGGIWLAGAGLFFVLTIALVLGAAVAWITTFDIRLHFAFLIVAAGMALSAAVSYLVGRGEAQSTLTPIRTVNQVKRDIVTAKEQLT